MSAYQAHGHALRVRPAGFLQERPEKIRVWLLRPYDKREEVGMDNLTQLQHGYGNEEHECDAQDLHERVRAERMNRDGADDTREPGAAQLHSLS